MLPASIDFDTFLVHGGLPVADGVVVDVPAPEPEAPDGRSTDPNGDLPIGWTYPMEVIETALGIDPDVAFRACLARSTPPMAVGDSYFPGD